MAVIINLKELFSSDAQDIYVDKVNFNFNKLLELGIGQPGPQGIAGPLGSAGPQGIQGDNGQRGNKWFVGVGDPNTQIFTDLLIGDFYLETISSSVYQYQGSPSTWIQITDFTSIVNNIISSGSTPFIRGFGLASPDDNRYITFTRHGNDLADINTDITLANSANNDTLLLNNWNEKVTTIDNFPASTDDEFNAIQTISVDHTASPLGRYHLELGSLYTDGPDTLLSEINNNLKLKYTKSISTPSYYPLSNEIINKAKFSLTLPEDEGNLTLIDQQGFFEFETPVYNIDTGTPQQSRFYTKIGTSEPLKETSVLDISSDGIEFKLDNYSISIGIVRNIESQLTGTLPTSLYGDYGIINVSDFLDRTYIKGDLYFDKGSLNKIYTDSYSPYESEMLDSILQTTTDAQGYGNIFSDGQYLMAVQSNNGTLPASVSVAGTLKIWDISDPNSTMLVNSFVQNSDINAGDGSDSYDIHGNPHGDGPFPGYVNSSRVFNGSIPLTNARDIVFAGKYGIIVRKIPISFAPPISPDVHFKDSFLVFELDSDKRDVKIVSWLGASTTFSSFMTGSTYQGTTIPDLNYSRRVKINGNWAYVMTDKSDTALNDSNIIAIDITDPRRPYVDGAYIDTKSLCRHIDFDIQNNVAYTLSMTSLGALQIYKVSLHEPTKLSTTLTNATTIDSFTVIPTTGSISGSIKVIGDRIFVVYLNKLYIYRTNRISSTPALISATALPVNYTGHDVEISGRYLYVYAEDVANARSCIINYDITDYSFPLLLDPVETFGTGTGNGKPGKMTMVGNKIYTLAVTNNTDTGGVRSIEIDGINAPTAMIGNIQSKDIKVSNNVSIGKNLQVRNSATIGSGGLWVDSGQGIHTDGGVNVAIKPKSITDVTNNAVTGVSIEANGVKYSTAPSSFPSILGQDIKINDISDVVASALLFTIGQSIAMNNIDATVVYPQAITVSNVTNVTQISAISINMAGITTTGSVQGITVFGEDSNYLSGDLIVGGELQVSGDKVGALQSATTAISLFFTASGSGGQATTPVLSSDKTTYFWFGGAYSYLYIGVETAPLSGIYVPNYRERYSGGTPQAYGNVLVPANCRVQIDISATGSAQAYYRTFGI